MLGVFLYDSEGEVTSVLSIVFSVIMTGYVISRAASLISGLDVWEKAIVWLLAGICATFSLFTASEHLATVSFNQLTIMVALPSVAVGLGALSYLKVPPMISWDDMPGLTILKNDFSSMSKPLRTLAIVALAVMMAIAGICGFLLLEHEEKGFTEFYILNEEGHAYDFPREMVKGENATIIVGIINHEGSTVDYSVELWLVNYSNVNMAVNVTQMYYVHSFNITLDHQKYDLNAPWAPQFEATLTFTPQVSGDFQLFVMLFSDGSPQIPGPSPPDPLLDLSKTDASWRIVMCVNNEINYLMIYVGIDP
ncbi:MAG: hypothetical protein A4E30_00028 [Methanomassiliicoccales archaeon PtaB.Bin215]|nr:MAG: hypothetical protein A4E30_00028 [Methanomassiliicoccales archaeon PtaB.Bin215]